MGWNLDDYEPVEERLARFWKDHPKGRLSTTLVSEAPEGSWIVFAQVFRDIADSDPASTGMAQEVINSTAVNRTSALENCETSAIGRALANLGYAPKGKRASREEMAKAKEEPVEPPKAEVEAPAPPPDATDIAERPLMIKLRKEIRQLRPQVYVVHESQVDPLAGLSLAELEQIKRELTADRVNA